MVPPDSDRVSRQRSYSGTTIDRSVPFRLRDDCPLWCTVPRASASTRLCNSRRAEHDAGKMSYNPQSTTCATYIDQVWADPFSLATTQGVSVDFFSSGYLDVSVRPVTLYRLCIHLQMTPHYRRRVFPFGDPRVKGCSAPHRGLSQPSTSFFGSRCQGIHRVPFLS